MHPSTGGGRWEQLPDGTHVVTLDTALGRRDRNAVLAHELIHVERGIGWGAATAATMQHEEAQVRRETARRLVPIEELSVFVAARAENEPVTAELVADEFDVPVAVAALALRLLAA